MSKAEPSDGSATMAHIEPAEDQIVVYQPNETCRLTGTSSFFIHAYWNLKTTMTTFKNNMILRAHLEHPELW